MQQEKRLLYFIDYISLLAFLPFIVLAFYDRPSADDLFLHYDLHKRGVADTYLYMYTQLSSRYTSLMVLFTLVYFKCILQHYFIVPLLMFALMYSGIFFCLAQTNRFIFGQYFCNRKLHIISRLFLLLFVVVMPEPATGFYWLSGCITHQLPIILLLFSCSFYLAALHSLTYRNVKLIISAAFLFLAVGCNEMIALYLATVLFLYCIYLKIKGSRSFNATVVLFFAAIIGNTLLFFGSGQQHRAGHFNLQASLPYALGASFLNYFLLLGKLFSTPFFWFCMVGLLVLYKYIPARPRFSFSVKWWGAYFACMPFIFYFLVYLVNPSGVPERANNPVAFILLVSLSIMICHSSSKIIPWKLPMAANKYSAALLCGSFMLTLLFSHNYLVAVGNQVSGPLYRYIFDKRIGQLKEARAHGRNIVTLDSYTHEWQTYIRTKMPEMLYKPMTKLVDPYPRTIFFCDDINDPNWITSYAEYYDIDTIQVEGKKHLRFSLDIKAREENNDFK